MSVILQYLHSRVGILYHVRVLYSEQISTAYTMSAHRITSIPHKLGTLPSECYTTSSVRNHHIASIPHRLGPLLSECYYMVSTYECRNTLHTRVLSVKQILTTYKMLILSFVTTHRRASIPHRLGPLLSECYSMVSRTECGYSPYESNICRSILS